MTEKSKIFRFPSRARIEAQAAEWIVLLESSAASAEDVARFNAWLSTNEQNRACYERLSAAWGQLDHLSLLEDIAKSDDVSELLEFNRRAPAQRNFRRAAAALAAVALASLVTWTGMDQFSRQDARFTEAMVTTVGEVRDMPLPDGSVIRLNTDSRVEIDFTRSTRHVALLKGEAFFEVAHDTQRPFSVIAGDRQVRAVGTAFNVRLTDDLVSVTVENGRVALLSSAGATSADKPLKELTQISVGQHALFGARVEQLEVMRDDAMQRSLSWRSGMLAFSGEPLSYMIAEVSRYSDIKIEIDDEELRDMPVAGYFKIGEVESMLEVLELMSNVKVERLDDGRVRLVRKKQ